MPPKFKRDFGFNIEEPSSTRVDIPIPQEENPYAYGSIQKSDYNLIDKISNLFPDTGPTGLLKGLYRGTDRNLFGLLPSGNYETPSPEADLGKDMSIIVDPLTIARGYRSLNKATAPMRAKMIRQSSTKRIHSKNYDLLNKHFDKLDIPIDYVHQKPLQGTAGSYTSGAFENIKMYIPDNWFKMKPYKKGASDTLIHEKVHALQKHKGTTNMIFDPAKSWRTNQKNLGITRGMDFDPKATLMDFKNLPNMGKAINKQQWKANVAKLGLKWRAKRALSDTFHPGSLAFKTKSTLERSFSAHHKYVSRPLEVEARVGSIWGSSKLRNNRQLRDLQKSGYSNKQIEGLLWNFDKTMKRIETQNVYDNLFRFGDEGFGKSEWYIDNFSDASLLDKVK